jgi:hypothetical protein
MNDSTPLRPPLAPLPARPAGSAAHPAKSKPDPRPMRVALGAAGLAAFSALAGAIVLPPRPVVLPPVYAQQGVPVGVGTTTGAQTPIQYVQLQPGQTAPPGATVIDPSGPRPTAIPAAPAPAQKPIIIKTTQSGKVVP